MKNKKWYIIAIVSVVVLVGLFFVVKQNKSDSMDGTYYYYYGDDEFNENIVMTIKGDDVTIPSSNNEGMLNLTLDKTHQKLNGSVSVPYTYKDGVFSFSDAQYIKSDSDIYKKLSK